MFIGENGSPAAAAAPGIVTRRIYGNASRAGGNGQ